MAETMQAVVNHGINDFRLDEVPKPRISLGEVLMKSTLAASARRMSRHRTA